MTWAMVCAIGGMVGLPLTIMVLYLRAIRDDQKQLRAEHSKLERRVGYVERDYATKEELVRETAELRQQLREGNNLLRQLVERGDTETGIAAQLRTLAEELAKATKR